jgi:hypothetical protein
MANLTLSGVYVPHGNMKGFAASEEGSVLHTSDLSSCVAVCGYKDGRSFMIHSDSLRQGVSGATLMQGIKKVASIGNGTGWAVSLIGGSTASASAYLKSQIPGAMIRDFGESEDAYVTQSGAIARSKDELARVLGVTSVSITPQNAHAPGTSISMAASYSPFPSPQYSRESTAASSSTPASAVAIPSPYGQTSSPNRFGSS